MLYFEVEVIGWITVAVVGASILYNLGHFIYTAFLGHVLGHSLDLRKYGPWAVVTGATDGIGKSYAKQLAKAGLNVVLISRSPAKLEAVADEIKSKHGDSIEVKTIAVDFTEGQSIYPLLKAELSQLEIGILFNNVGMSFGPVQFANIESDQQVHDMVNCNIMSMTRMCHLVLPQMIQRKKGIIVNNGSITCTMPTPYITLYGATKAFVDKFSRDLSAEVKSSGVIIQALHPGYFVCTNMVPLEKPNFNNPDTDTYVTAAIQSLGLEERTAAYWAHKVQFYFAELANFFCHRLVQNMFYQYGTYQEKIWRQEGIIGRKI